MMNKAFRETLSAIVSVNEQFARSTRIDGDNIDETGFIYSESIDMYLRPLILQNLGQLVMDQFVYCH